MLRVVAISIVLVFLGVLYVLANPNDPGMKGFGWALVVIGSIIAAVFLYLWTREYMAEETSSSATSRPDRSRGGAARRRR